MKLYSAMYGDWHPMDMFFPQATCVVVSQEGLMDEPGFLILHGGVDIDPALYKRGRSSKSHHRGFNGRDDIEMALIREAQNKNIPIVGWCRGAQLMCAAAGGYLIQDISGHGCYAGHIVTTDGGEQFHTNTLHHQMQAPWNIEHKLLASTPERHSDHYLDEDTHVEVPCEVEAVFYPQLKGLGFQWHPEMMSHTSKASKWIYSQIGKYLNVA